MQMISVNLNHTNYNIYVGRALLPELAHLLEKHQKARQIAIITTRWIYEQFGPRIQSGFRKDVQLLPIFVPDGEGAKSFEQLQHIYTRLLEHKYERSSVILALGGGVIGDLAGFAAATYLRGVSLVQVPTTLLAQVDSSIGGKVGINHALGKNLIGAFKQPLFVLSDIETLQTLPEEEIRCGMGEVIKYGFISNRELFAYLEAHLEAALRKDMSTMEYLVKVSAEEKGKVVEQDEKEQNLRMILNFGHTFGHALEAEFNFSRLKHGEAVILGMKCALSFARSEGMLPGSDYERGMRLLNRMPVHYDPNRIQSDRLLQRMMVDKKVQNSQMRLVLIDRIGSPKIYIAEDAKCIKQAYNVLID